MTTQTELKAAYIYEKSHNKDGSIKPIFKMKATLHKNNGVVIIKMESGRMFHWDAPFWIEYGAGRVQDGETLNYLETTFKKLTP